MSIPFDNSYTSLPERFFTRQDPATVSKPALLAVNHQLASYLGIDPVWLESEEGLEILSGNTIPDGADPIATVYAGHQFGHWNPRLGDGRAVLLGEVLATDGERYDIQLKGSGQTPYSRNGDGRAPLGPIIREFIMSEAMASLGVPTSRSLAAVATGDSVYRESKLSGGVLARVAKSHIRFGTFQYFSAIQDAEGFNLLVNHTIERHYPEVNSAEIRALALFEQVSKKLAELVAQWQSVGFIHGVMNTDNMLLSGETIDYGPCAFMDQFDPSIVFSSIDHAGRYAYKNQPAIAQWNLACLGQTLLPLISDDTERATEMAQTVLNQFPEYYQDQYRDLMSRKLGLTTRLNEDAQLIQEFLDLLEANQLDFTLAFRRLADLVCDDEGIRSLFEFPNTCDLWIAKWHARCDLEEVNTRSRTDQMRATNPIFIPRNHLVEEAIERTYAGDNSAFDQLNVRLSNPFDYATEDSRFALPPELHQVIQQTFCGT
jgi:serine/tyrosine/threonine adenylyltransferase